MEKKFTMLDCLAQIFMIYGITTLLLNIFCLLFGDDAQGFSSIFALGSDGISVSTAFQFLLTNAVIVALRFIIMNDFLIKKMSEALRIVLMFASVMAVSVAAIFLFGWFPTDNITAWVMFVVCFVISALISTFVSVISERQENKKLEQALKRCKGEQ